MKRSVHLDRLAKVPMFRSLAKKDLQRIARLSTPITVEKGTELTKQGTVGYEFFMIGSGKAVVKRNKRKVAQLKTGDFFGELALLDDVPRNATVVADSDMELLVLSRQEFAGILREVPEMAVKMLKTMAHRLSDADAKSVH